MIQAGKNVTAKDDPLQKIKVAYFYHKLKNPDPEIESRIRQLRIVRQLDPRQYSLFKRQLPYIVCGSFNPAYRRTENFGYTEYYIVDIDHIGDKNIDILTLRQRIETDKRVVLSFLSPGEDGLKLMFKLSERCYDAGIYQVFYKLFVAKFARQYEIEQVIDARTCDVARACFISIDSNAYYNPDAELVDMSMYLNTDDASELFRIKKQVENEANLPARSKDESVQFSPDDEVLTHIKALLNQGKPFIPKREVFVPEQLNETMKLLLPHLEQAGIKTSAIENIQYGKKLKLKVGLKEAEINVFYGKKGYSVVISPRRGTNDELNTLAAMLIEQYLLRG
ncbi:MAG: virulence protein E [Paludibacter sp. 47-17]|nr:MAG: virulence protein E [Paludibacter sp. 47-17]